MRRARASYCARVALRPLEGSLFVTAGGVNGAASSSATRRKTGLERVRQVTVSQRRLEEFIRAELSYFAQQQAQPLHLEQIVNHASPSQVARLVHRELPVRFAARIKHLELIEGWQNLPHYAEIHALFCESFRYMRLVEFSNLEEFNETIRALRLRHKRIVPLLSAGLRELEREGVEAANRRCGPGGLDGWADAFMMSRISTEMLTSHYTACMEERTPGSASGSTNSMRPRSWHGIVDTKCDPVAICREAVAKVQAEANGEIDFELSLPPDADQIMFSYIPRYLLYIIEELLRNAVRAVLGRSDSRRPPVRIAVCADQRQVGIRIADEGGGIPFGSADRVWSYLFSTSQEQFEDYAKLDSPLSGRGMGLPLGRLYASYLGGSLELMNVPGVGVDAYLFLSRIDIQENISSLSSIGTSVSCDI